MRARFGSTSWMVVLAVWAPLTACASSSVQSNRDPNYRGRVSSVLVIVVHAGHADDAQTMASSLQRELADKHIDARAIALATDGTPPTTPTSFHPEAVLTVRANTGTVAMFGERVEVGYDVNLVLTTDPGRRIWRARATHSGDGFMMVERIQKAAAAIVARLIQDDLVSPHKPES